MYTPSSPCAFHILLPFSSLKEDVENGTRHRSLHPLHRCTNPNPNRRCSKQPSRLRRCTQCSASQGWGWTPILGRRTWSLRYKLTSKIKTCEMVHSVGPYGENLATANGVLTTAAAVNTWAAEEKYYNHNSNKCVGGKCRHYTQLVWKNSFLVGCATVKCKDNWSSVISCNYSPSRNVVGERPY